MSRVYQAINTLKAHGASLSDPGETASVAVSDYRVVRAAPAANAPVFPYEGEDSHAGEQYRLVRTRALARQPHARLIAVASANAGDGKTITAINTAGVFAMRGTDDVLLIGADLRHPDLTVRLGVPGEPGLADVLAGDCALSDAVLRIEQFPRLHVLPAGRRSCNATELFESQAWPDMCEEVRRLFRLAIFDTAPIGVVADYELIQAQCDSVLLVAKTDHTKRKSLFAALAAVPEQKLLGVVLNGVEKWLFWRTPDYSYRYGDYGRAGRSSRAAAAD